MRSACVVALVLACGERPAVQPSTPALDVPPLPPPKATDVPAAVDEASPRADPNDESPLPQDPHEAAGYFQQAHQAVANGDLARARALFLKSYRFDPTAASLLNLAVCEEQLGRRDDALRHYQAAHDAWLVQGRPENAVKTKERMDALRSRP